MQSERQKGKEQWECEKLAEEIRRLKSPWWRVASWASAVAPIAAATAAIIVPWALGIFSVKADKIELEVKRFEAQRGPLSNEIVRLTAERGEMAKRQQQLVSDLILKETALRRVIQEKENTERLLQVARDETKSIDERFRQILATNQSAMASVLLTNETLGSSNAMLGMRLTNSLALIDAFRACMLQQYTEVVSLWMPAQQGAQYARQLAKGTTYEALVDAYFKEFSARAKRYEDEMRYLLRVSGQTNVSSALALIAQKPPRGNMVVPERILSE
jgi:hypothetical protein